MEKGETIGRVKEREESGKREQQKLVQTVLNCHLAGIPAETIATITGLAETEIKKIIDEHT